MCIDGTSPARPSSPSLDVWSLGRRSIIRVCCDCYESIEKRRGLSEELIGRVRGQKRGDNQTIKHAHIESD